MCRWISNLNLCQELQALRGYPLFDISDLTKPNRTLGLASPNRSQQISPPLPIISMSEKTTLIHLVTHGRSAGLVLIPLPLSLSSSVHSPPCPLSLPNPILNFLSLIPTYHRSPSCASRWMNARASKLVFLFLLLFTHDLFSTQEQEWYFQKTNHTLA